MEHISVEQILQKAREYHAGKQSWHFHILTPECCLNDRSEYALVLESAIPSSTFVNYSVTRPLEAGKVLVQLLHGDDVTLEETSDLSNASTGAKEILQKALQLSAEHRFWHHHTLFPDCSFNKNKGKWTIIFEDQENNEILESVSDSEPKADLKHIETLFYGQSKA